MLIFEYISRRVNVAADILSHIPDLQAATATFEIRACAPTKRFAEADTLVPAELPPPPPPPPKAQPG